MSSLPQRFARTPRIAPLASGVGRMLRLLGQSPQPDWAALADIAAGDPVLCHALLAAAPLNPDARGDKLTVSLATRLADLGTGLLQTWLLGQTPTLDEAAREELARRARLTAECALHLAIQTHYPHPDEAYLAGLWHALGQTWMCQWQPDPPPPGDGLPSQAELDAEQQRHGTDRLAVSARLAEECGASPVLADALQAYAAPWEHLATAHPLARVLRAAVQLAGPRHDSALAELAAETGLPEATLLSLRTDCAFLAGEKPPATAQIAGFPSESTAHDPAPPLPMAWQGVLARGLSGGAFNGLDPDAAARRLALACPLLFGRRPPLLLIRDENHLTALPLPGQAPLVSRLAELSPRADDPQSLVALTLRAGHPTTLPAARGLPGRNALDWHLSRWLGGGLLCLPLVWQGQRGVAVCPGDEGTELEGGDHTLLSTLLEAAFAALLSARQAEAGRAAAAAEQEARLRAHARKVAHEARNPLSVIRSYLHLIGQRHAGDRVLGADLPLIDAELSRLDALMRNLADPPAAEEESPSCDAVAVLDDMRRLHAETLFAQRGIRFDLRAAQRLPAIAMPASALRQVLLNLFRNASEALHQGGSFSVSVPGVVLAGGRPSLELRLLDNGPGLPPERLGDLFTPHDSGKGDGHMGVGLSVVKEIIDRHGATLLCRSQSGTGTSFQLFIPLAKSR